MISTLAVAAREAFGLVKKENISKKTKNKVPSSISGSEETSDLSGGLSW